MMTTQMLSDELMLPEHAVQASHPMDSSGLLLELMKLSRRAASTLQDAGGDALDGVISKNVLRSLLSALHVRDLSTVRHSRRAAMLCVGLAQYLGWEGRQLKVLEVAALLHDIGKIGVPDNILFKPGTLSPDEAELMALHHNIGIDVLQACRVDSEVLQIVGQSLHFDNGISDGRERMGNDVHLGARILAVCDAYDSMRTEQVYREGRAHEDVMAELANLSGVQFDGNVVCALSRWMQTESGRLTQQAPDMDSGRPRGMSHSREAMEAGSLGHILAYLYLLESLYDGFYLLDSDMRFVVWNRGAERLLGYGSTSMLNQMWTSRRLEYADGQGESLKEEECLLKRVMQTGKAATATVQIRHADGRWVEVELQSVPLLDQHGELQGAAEIFRDVSRNSRRPQEYRKLKAAASRDSLTKLANRGEMESQLIELVNRYEKSHYSQPFCVIFSDVDFFKSVNDTYGHVVGDQVLVDVAKLLQHETYSGELVARYGGEEFVILCPDTELEQALKRAERLRMAINHQQIEGMSDRRISASFGVTQVEPGDSLESVLRRADKALYMAKETGRNRTCSLTSEQLGAAEEAKQNDGNESADPFTYVEHFRACVAADMVVYKLGGFVHDHKAKLLEVTSERALVRLGTRGLLPFWGGSDHSRPVTLEIIFGDPNRSRSPGRTVQVTVEVRVRPLGWIRNSDTFVARAKRGVKELRSYFAAWD